MIGDVARRSLAKAAELNTELKAAASGDEASREAAIQTLRRKRRAAQINYPYCFPQDEGGELFPTLLSVGQYEYTGGFSNTQLAMAGAMMAAELISAAGFDPPTASRNLDNFAKAVSNRGAGFRDPFRMALAPRCAAAARRNRVGFDKNQLLVFRNG